MLKASLAVALCVLLVDSFVYAEEIIVKVSLVNDQGVGKEIGTITACDSTYGLILTPQLSDLAPGLHEFHVHDKPDCQHASRKMNRFIFGLLTDFKPSLTKRE